MVPLPAEMSHNLGVHVYFTLTFKTNQLYVNMVMCFGRGLKRQSSRAFERVKENFARCKTNKNKIVLRKKELRVC